MMYIIIRARHKSSKNRSLPEANEHFETIYNTAMA